MVIGDPLADAGPADNGAAVGVPDPTPGAATAMPGVMGIAADTGEEDTVEAGEAAIAADGDAEGLER